MSNSSSDAPRCPDPQWRWRAPNQSCSAQARWYLDAGHQRHWWPAPVTWDLTKDNGMYIIYIYIYVYSRYIYIYIIYVYHIYIVHICICPASSQGKWYFFYAFLPKTMFWTFAVFFWFRAFIVFCQAGFLTVTSHFSCSGLFSQEPLKCLLLEQRLKEYTMENAINTKQCIHIII